MLRHSNANLTLAVYADAIYGRKSDESAMEKLEELRRGKTSVRELIGE